jgi:hypothetical protein
VKQQGEVSAVRPAIAIVRPSAHSLLLRERDNPAAVAAELPAIQEAITDVLNLIEADLELDRVRGLGQDEMSADQRRDLLDAQNWKRTDALVALTRKP